MKKKPQSEAELFRQGLLETARIVAEARGAVLFDRAARPFAIYPPLLPQQVEDPGAPERMREILARRLRQEELREAVRNGTAFVCRRGEGG
jgi:hypothetical protein